MRYQGVSELQMFHRRIKLASSWLRTLASKPPARATIYAWSAVTLWLSMAGIVAIVYFAARVGRSVGQSPSGLIVSLVADLVLCIVLGLWLYRSAKRWHGAEHGFATIIGRLTLRALCFSLVAAAFVALSRIDDISDVSPASIFASLGQYGWMSVILDHLLFWLVAGTVVPLPWLLPETLQASIPPPEFVTLRSNGKVEQLPVAQVKYAVAADNYVELHFEGGSRLHRSTLTEFGMRFGAAGLVRIGRGVLVNMHHVSTLYRNGGRHWEVRMADGATFPVARRYRPLIGKALDDRSPH